LDSSFVSLGAVNAQMWDALVSMSDEGWPFALSAWQRLILAVEEWGLIDRSFIMMQDGRIVAVMPLQFKPASKVLASSGWGGTGPVVADTLSAKWRTRVLSRVLEHAEQIGLELGATCLEFWMSPVTRASIGARWGVNPFVFHGFEDRSGISQVIDLSKPDQALWRDVSETARHAIRRAKDAGITVEEGAWPEMVDEYYSVHVETYTRTGVAPHPKAYFEGIARAMWPLRHSILWVARDHHGQAVAFQNTLWFREGAYYHTACSTQTALDSGANYLLFWHALLAAKVAGIRWYDCGEIAPGEITGKRLGLTIFKSKFGGEPHRFFKCAKTLITMKSECVNNVSGFGHHLSSWLRRR